MYQLGFEADLKFLLDEVVKRKFLILDLIGINIR